MTKSNDWLVVMTKPKIEVEAEVHLLRQGFEVYLPLWIDLRRRQGRWQKVQVPMFPRYLFIRQTYAEQSLAPIRSTCGVSKLVKFGIEPAWARESLIQQIRQLESGRHVTDPALTPFKKGDQVQVLDGPFAGVSAEVFSCDQQRVILLLQVLGKAHQLEFHANACQMK